MRRGFCLMLTLVLFQTPAGPTSADAPSILVDTIEEDWQLVVATPSTDEVGPQITTCMYPGASDGTKPFIAYDMNYREYPGFTPGGMQIQVWDSGNVMTYASQGSGQLATDNETIAWTQRLSIAGGAVDYQVNNGSSTTWGQFGQGSGSNLHVTYDASFGDLTGYSPDTSARKSGVTWQSNRVTSMTLLRVRYYVGNTLVATDSTARPITMNSN